MSGPDVRARSPQDIIAGAFFVAVGIGGLWISLSYPLGTSFNMGPGYFPSMIFGAMIVVGAGVLARGLLISGNRLERTNLRALGFVIGSLLFFAFAARILGFALSAGISIFLSTYAAPGLRLHERLLLVIGLTCFCWALFLFGLGLVMPLWPTVAQ